jgi:hypothetical protein
MGKNINFLFPLVIQSLLRFENVSVLTNMHMDDHCETFLVKNHHFETFFPIVVK